MCAIDRHTVANYRHIVKLIGRHLLTARPTTSTNERQNNASNSIKSSSCIHVFHHFRQYLTGFQRC